jgi:replication factor C subunit 3/5
MFLFEKYRPKKINDLVFNKKILEQLMFIASNENIPHIIIAGPVGGGKKTLVKFFLEALYDPDVNDLSRVKYNISGSSTKKEVEILQSNYHIIIEPTNTNHDKYILQEIIKQYAIHKSFNIFKTQRKFKTIVIYNIENLANNSQAALRRTMELYARTCRFVMVCNNLSKVFDPLRSRCRTFCTQLPSTKEILNIISYISIMENITVSQEKIKLIINNCNNNLKIAIWMLDAIRYDCNPIIPLDDAFNSVIKLIFEAVTDKNIVKIFDWNIRAHIYNTLITNIRGTEVIVILLDELIKRIDNDEICSKIIQFASVAENNLIHGRRDITNIDFFILAVMDTLCKYNFQLKIEVKIEVPAKPIKAASGSKTNKNKEKIVVGSKTNKKRAKK